MHVAVVYGTRPEIIKLIPLILEIKEHRDLKLSIVNTGQHKEMVHELEQLFGIVPDYSLDIMRHDQTLTDIMKNVAITVEPVLKELRPDIVILQGDTSTVATVGTICFYNKIPVGHVEAGLRSYNLEEPFPEEFNRRVISIMARLNFAPTAQSADNLLREGIPAEKIFVTGNTVVDMVRLARQRITQHSNGTERKILVTAHRRENHGEGIDNIIAAIKEVSRLYPDLVFTWPVHPNPNVKQTVYQQLQGMKNIRLTDPMGYMDLIKEIDTSFLVWSDSGGIQEECPSFKKPLLILRNITERPEVVTSGFGELIGTDTDRIVRRTVELLSDNESYRKMTSGKNPFGDGTASRQIVDILRDYYKQL
ncbi:non-hydrolyzing UDP-N-acetylglucosamine 2-epimerase [Puia sp. P3]|uniref:non-hydrolyzing UDP-N-acetylglucosamine 2-epimerase n=1 Tax=Puia sp. P3 TaxID=3423952 RepID=UPI003D67E772